MRWADQIKYTVGGLVDECTRLTCNRFRLREIVKPLNRIRSGCDWSAKSEAKVKMGLNGATESTFSWPVP